MSYLQYLKKTEKEQISAPVLLVLDSLTRTPERWNFGCTMAFHKGNNAFRIQWGTANGKIDMETTPPIVLNSAEKCELQRVLLFAAYTNAENTVTQGEK